MPSLRVSLIIETINVRFDNGTGSLADDLTTTLRALDAQTYPRDLTERIVVLDKEVDEGTVAELRARYPKCRFILAPSTNYFAAKNAGADAATGDALVMVDSDCTPEPDWLERLVRPLSQGAAAVAGRTRYVAGSWEERVFSVQDFAHIVSDQNGEATGFNLSNVAFRREAFLRHRLNERIPRNGGCYLLFHQLKGEGGRIVYASDAKVSHAVDFAGPLGMVRKHFERGHDGAIVYGLDDGAALRGTPLVRRYGALALIALTARRIVLDWKNLARNRSQMGFVAAKLPTNAAIAVVTRTIELAGGLYAMLSGRYRATAR